MYCEGRKKKSKLFVRVSVWFVSSAVKLLIQTAWQWIAKFSDIYNRLTMNLKFLFLYLNCQFKCHWTFQRSLKRGKEKRNVCRTFRRLTGAVRWTVTKEKDLRVQPLNCRCFWMRSERYSERQRNVTPSETGLPGSMWGSAIAHCNSKAIKRRFDWLNNAHLQAELSFFNTTYCEIVHQIC